MNFVSLRASLCWLAVSLFCTAPCAQTLYLIGGALKTCSSLAPKNCTDNTSFPSSAKTHNLYRVDERSRHAIDTLWPSSNTNHRLATSKLLKDVESENVLTKQQLVALIKHANDQLYRNWSTQEYHFVFDMLEVPLIIGEKRVVEQVKTERNQELASSQILEAIVADLSKTRGRKIYVITASSRDPYESADFYQGLFTGYDVQASWLPLTPALAKAISENNCDKLDTYRNELNQVYNREKIYPDLVHIERQLCLQGSGYLTNLIEGADALFFNGGDQSLTIQAFQNNAKNESYPWASAIRNRPILIGTSAGTAMQAGGKNAFGKVPMITNGSSINALKNGAIDKPAPSENCQQHGDCNGLQHDVFTFKSEGGLGSFNLGVLDTHFSERGRTPRLAVLMKATGQKFGIGVDETTALKVEKKSADMTVLGKHGVVVLEKTEDSALYYNYFPSASVFNLTNTPQIALSTETRKGKKVTGKNLISNGKIRDSIQQSCRDNSANIEVEEKDVSILLEFTKTTQCQLQANGQYMVKNLRLYL